LSRPQKYLRLQGIAFSNKFRGGSMPPAAAARTIQLRMSVIAGPGARAKAENAKAIALFQSPCSHASAAKYRRMLFFAIGKCRSTERGAYPNASPSPSAGETSADSKSGQPGNGEPRAIIQTRSPAPGRCGRKRHRVRAPGLDRYRKGLAIMRFPVDAACPQTR